MRAGIIIGALALLLTGCTRGDETPPAPSSQPIASASVPTSQPSATTGQPAPNVGTPSERTGEVEEAVRLMQDELDLPADEIRVIRVEDVVWPSSSLGCPAEGGTETQGPVAGYRIVLGHGVVELHYHGADGAEPRRCDFLDF